VAAQEETVAQIEGVVHVSSGMVQRSVQRREIVPLGFRLRAAHTRETERAEDVAQRLDVGVLHSLLGHVEIAGDAHRRPEHVRPLTTVRVRDSLLHGAGRWISMLPLSAATGTG
jgi:hypothetical protein